MLDSFCHLVFTNTLQFLQVLMDTNQQVIHFSFVRMDQYAKAHPIQYHQSITISFVVAITIFVVVALAQQLFSYD